MPSRPAAPATAPDSGGAAADPSRQGLSGRQAAERLQREGPNSMPRSARRGPWITLLALLHEPMVLLLIAAAGIYWLLGDAAETLLLAFSIMAVIGLTFYQERKSEAVLDALRELGSPRARVIRDGRQLNLAARELVRGDLIVLAAGDRVPADARLIESADVAVDESLLSGESVAVDHDAGNPGTAMIHAGTLMVRGHALAEVTATGRQAAIGRIGSQLEGQSRQRSPLQRELRVVVVRFAILALASCALVVILYGLQKHDWLGAMLAGITLAISNVPEEFPVVLTVFLALGAGRLARQKALVRNVPAVEALGSISVLCVDKTGTLTENRMRVKRILAASDGTEADDQLLDIACLASDDQPYDPMERALHQRRFDSAQARRAAGASRVREYPLESARPFTAHAWRQPGASGLTLACKGAPESVAAACRLPPAVRARVEARVADMAADGLRVLGVARAQWPEREDRPLPDDPVQIHWQWLGLVGFADPLREHVPAAIAEARSAGVRVIMLTGDHVATARAIADAAGLDSRSGVILGSDIDRMDEPRLQQCVATASVFARVRPEHKLRLVHALRAAGETVAMTGDGVNDAPALMAADVGIAMGERGTDVAREAASIVLMDDNFVSVVGAIRQGRRIYDNLGHAVRYVLAVHVPITGLALLPLLIGAPIVLLPIHVVFLELIIDPACALVFEREPAAADVMSRPPRNPQGNLLDTRTVLTALGSGLLACLATSAVFLLATRAGMQTGQVASLSYTSLVAGNLALIFAYRSRIRRPGQVSGQSVARPHNKALWIVVSLALAALSVALFWAPAQAWFHFAPVSPIATATAFLLPVAAIILAALAGRLLPALSHRRER